MPQVIYMPENKNTVGAQMAQMLPMLQQLALAKIQRKWTNEDNELELEREKTALEEQRKWEETQAKIAREHDIKLKKIPTKSISVRDTDPNKQRNTEIDRRTKQLNAELASLGRMQAPPSEIQAAMEQAKASYKNDIALIENGVYNYHQYTTGKDVYDAFQSGELTKEQAVEVYRRKGLPPYVPPKTDEEKKAEAKDQPVDMRPKSMRQPAEQLVRPKQTRTQPTAFADRIQRNRALYSTDYEQRRRLEEERERNRIARELAMMQLPNAFWR